MNECWAKPSSIYTRKIRHWSGSSPLLRRSENALSTWLARTWASANVRRYIEARIVVRGFPLCTITHYYCHPPSLSRLVHDTGIAVFWTTLESSEMDSSSSSSESSEKSDYSL